MVELDELRRMDGPPPIDLLNVSRDVARKCALAAREIERSRALLSRLLMLPHGGSNSELDVLCRDVLTHLTGEIS